MLLLHIQNTDLMANTIFRNVLNLVLLCLVIYTGYRFYNALKEPIEFDIESKQRMSSAVDRLKDIRKAQEAWKKKHGSYTANLDSLIEMVKIDSFKVITAIGDKNDSLAVARKQVKEVVSYVMISDSLYAGDISRISAMKYVPYTKPPVAFEAYQGEIVKNTVDVKVFEVSTPFTTLYNGLDDEYFDKYGILRVGSRTEATTSGNWE